MTAPYHMAVYSMYVAVCSNSAVAEVVVPLIYPLGMATRFDKQDMSANWSSM